MTKRSRRARQRVLLSAYPSGSMSGTVANMPAPEPVSSTDGAALADQIMDGQMPLGVQETVGEATVTGHIWVADETVGPEDPDEAGSRIGLQALGCDICGGSGCHHVDLTLDRFETAVNAMPGRYEWMFLRGEASDQFTARAAAALDLPNGSPVPFSQEPSPESLTGLDEAWQRRARPVSGLVLPTTPGLAERVQQQFGTESEYTEALGARSRYRPIPFTTEDGAALGEAGTGLTFGLELEYELPTRWSYRQMQAANDAIAADLNQLGLTSARRQQRYGSARHQGYTQWWPERDGSVNGGEIVSPILEDTQQRWEELASVLAVVRRHGGRATAQAGGHVHVNTSRYGMDSDNYMSLIMATYANEDVLYRLSQNPWRGQHRRGVSRRDGSRNTYAQPIPTHQLYEEDGYLWKPRRATAEERLHEIAGRFHPRYQALNFGNVNNGTARPQERVEWRLFDSVLYPEQVQAQVSLAAAFTDTARRLVAHGGQPDQWLEGMSLPAQTPTRTGYMPPDNRVPNPRGYGQRFREHESGERDGADDRTLFAQLGERLFGTEDPGSHRRAQFDALVASTEWNAPLGETHPQARNRRVAYTRRSGFGSGSG